MNKKVSGGKEERPRSRDMLPSDGPGAAQAELLAGSVRSMHGGVRGDTGAWGTGTCELVPP